jgi:ABC-2 type transport system permease protein
MRSKIVMLIARQFWSSTFHSKAAYGILTVIMLLVCFAAYTGWRTYTVQDDIREHYQRVVRESWENNPDKHPHRMAHFGSFAFRVKYPLSVFDFGLESYTGNAIYLEAHKQNTINFSEASFSTGLLRFGEISVAMLLQIILPLAIVFLGFSAVSADRENGTLKVMLTQGAGWKEILIGKSLGLMGLAMLIIVPAFVMTLAFMIDTKNSHAVELFPRYTATIFSYVIFLAVICLITIVVSAVSGTSKSALLKLLALWLLLAVILPRTMQALGSYFYPAPSKIEFETAIEEDVLKEGDSHNPDDPHYKHLRDSVLMVHQVDSVEKLPFNYSGFVMREGEKISANIYQAHLRELLTVYDKQNSITKMTAILNPFSAIRNVSMALSGTDFESYKIFQHQTEEYRYLLAQKMNELQMELISNDKAPHDKPHAISSDHWREVPDFKPTSPEWTTSIKDEGISFLALILWCVVALGIINRISKTLKAI